MAAEFLSVAYTKSLIEAQQDVAVMGTGQMLPKLAYPLHEGKVRNTYNLGTELSGSY